MSPDNTLDEKEPKHKRRPRYKGTHPKTFKEKYKELQPEQYADDVAKVIQKGRTPAGMHIPICVKEILEFLQIKPGQTGLDATLGYGGHTLEMLKCLDSKGRLYATDVDSFELPRTKDRLEHLGYGSEILEIKHMNFSKIDQIIPESGLFNFILADFGVSSMQIDNPERGFSPHSEAIARAIVSSIKKGIDISTTTQLRDIIKGTLKSIPKINEDEIKKSCQRCFQALRIDINEELDVIDEFLLKLPDVLAEGGRVAILTFHSGEDRRVKKSFKHFFREGIYREIAPDPIRPSSEECHANSRARSAKLRWAIKA